MNNLIAANVCILFIIGKFIFKDFKTFFKSLYWFIYPNFISIWNKDKWNKDIHYSTKLSLFILVIIVMAFANGYILKHLT